MDRETYLVASKAAKDVMDGIFYIKRKAPEMGDQYAINLLETVAYDRDSSPSGESEAEKLIRVSIQASCGIRQIENTFRGLPKEYLPSVCRAITTKRKFISESQAPPKHIEAATRGRRDVADGKRPKFKDSIALVIGVRQMKASEVFSGLQERGWVPNSGKPKEYVSFTLSREKDYFERVRRGVYQVKSGILDKLGA